MLLSKRLFQIGADFFCGRQCERMLCETLQLRQRFFRQDVFYARNARGTHTELVQSKTGKDGRKQTVAAHFAANAQRLVSEIADNAHNHAQYGRKRLLIIRLDLRILTIRRRKILTQIVCSNTGKVDQSSSFLGKQRDGGNLDHDADLAGAVRKTVTFQ